MLLAAAMLVFAAYGAGDAPTPPAELRVAVTAAVGLLAPLLWPGSAATARATALRVAAWSLAAAAAAAIALLLLGRAASPAITAAPCAMLLLVLLPTLAAAAALEPPLRRRGLDAAGARELAGRSIALLLALLGSLPLWLGPASEWLEPRHPGIVDAALALSPLTHLALASGNDLLHDAWLYQNSNLAALPVNYPEPAQLAWGYGSLLALLALAALATCLPHRARTGALTNPVSKEKHP